MYNKLYYGYTDIIRNKPHRSTTADLFYELSTIVVCKMSDVKM